MIPEVAGVNEKCMVCFVQYLLVLLLEFVLGGGYHFCCMLAPFRRVYNFSR